MVKKFTTREGLGIPVAIGAAMVGMLLFFCSISFTLIDWFAPTISARSAEPQHGPRPSSERCARHVE